MMDEIKKIAFINCSDKGSTGKIIKCIVDYTNSIGVSSVMIVPQITDHTSKETSSIVPVSNINERRICHRLSKMVGNKFGMAWFSTRKVISVLKKEKPDIVHVHCANGFFVNLYRLFHYLGKNEIPTVITNHAEFYYTGNCDHAFYCDNWKKGCGNCPMKDSVFDFTSFWWRRMKKSIQSIRYLEVISVSKWVYERSCQSQIMSGVQQSIVENAVDTDVFRIYDHNDISVKYPVFSTEKRIILYVTACFYGQSEKKGSKYLLELAKRLKDKDILIVVAGKTAGDSRVPTNVVLLGNIESQTDLAKMYSAASLSLITSERETFSMPVAESLCCGTPIVGFEAGGPESVSIDAYSKFVPFGNMDLLTDTVLEWLTLKSSEKCHLIQEAARKRYSKGRMASDYFRIYREVWEKKIK